MAHRWLILGASGNGRPVADAIRAQGDAVLGPSAWAGTSRPFHARQEPTQALGISVLQEPSVEEITTGRARIEVLHPMQLEELLGRHAAVTFRKGVTPRLPLRRPQSKVAPGSDWSRLLAC